MANCGVLVLLPGHAMIILMIMTTYNLIIVISLKLV